MRPGGLLVVAIAVAGVAAVVIGVVKLSSEDKPTPAPQRPSTPGVDVPPALRKLLDRMPDMKPTEADAAVRKLARTDPRTLPALIEILASPFSERRELQEALAAITSIGPDALPSAVAFFLESDGDVAKRAYTAVRHLIPTAGQWRSGADNPFARSWTAEQKKAARPYEAELLKRTQNGDANVRRYAVLILCALPLASRSEASIPALVDAFERDDAVVRAEAGYALMTSGQAARDAVPRIVRILDRKDEELRDQTFAVLARLGRDLPEVATALAKRLDEEHDRAEQTSLCVALAQMGPNAEPALPFIERALLSGDQARGRTAVNCLVTLETVALPVLLRALKHSDPLSRSLAAQAFGRLGATTPPEAERALEALTKDDDPDVAARAKQALERIAKARKG